MDAIMRRPVRAGIVALVLLVVVVPATRPLWTLKSIEQREAVIFSTVRESGAVVSKAAGWVGGGINAFVQRVRDRSNEALAKTEATEGSNDLQVALVKALEVQTRVIEKLDAQLEEREGASVDVNIKVDDTEAPPSNRTVTRE